MADVGEVKVVVAHNERATLRVDDVFLKIDSDQTLTDIEVEAMAMAPIPTPEVLWRKPPVLALAALPGTALGRLGEPSTASSAAWAAAGAAARMLHDAPLPPWPGRSLDEIASRLDGECEWLVTNGVLPTNLVTRNRRIAEAALRPWTPVFTHGDLQITHVFVDGDEVTGVIDWSEAGRGDALYDLATLTLGHEEHLADRRRRIRHRRRPRRDPRMVVVAESGGGPLADRARLRPVLARSRVRRAEVHDVRLHQPEDRRTFGGQRALNSSGSAVNCLAPSHSIKSGLICPLADARSMKGWPAYLCAEDDVITEQLRGRQQPPSLRPCQPHLLEGCWILQAHEPLGSGASLPSFLGKRRDDCHT